MFQRKTRALWAAVCVLALIPAFGVGAAGLPNPVREVTAEELREKTGIVFPRAGQRIHIAVLVFRAQVLEKNHVHAIETEPIAPHVLVREIGQLDIQRRPVLLQGGEHAPVQAHESEAQAG